MGFLERGQREVISTLVEMSGFLGGKQGWPEIMASKDPSMEVAKIVATIADPSREVARYNPREGNRGWPKIMANKDLYMEMTRDQSQRMFFTELEYFCSVCMATVFLLFKK